MELITYGQPRNVPAAVCLDLDGTIITTANSSSFSRHANDWKYLYPTVRSILTAFGNSHRYRVILFTNQLKYSEMRKALIENVVRDLNIPIEVYIATARDNYRKPGVGLFIAANDRYPIDLQQSFYCGDALDRPHDHSGADYWFAVHTGMRFITPEALFLDLPARDELLQLPNSLHVISPQVQPDLSKLVSPAYPDRPEIVIMMGLPGSGKTTLARHLFPNYVHISPDHDGMTTEKKRIEAINTALAQGRSVVVDQTHLSGKSRAYLLPYHPRAIHLATPLPICEKLIEFRSCFGGSYVPTIALRKLNSSYEAPTELARVDILPLPPIFPDTPLYIQWLIQSQ